MHDKIVMSIALKKQSFSLTINSVDDISRFVQISIVMVVSCEGSISTCSTRSVSC